MNVVLNIIYAVLIMVAVALVCSALLGPLLMSVNYTATLILGKALIDFSFFIGLLAGFAWYVGYRR